ncbi:MAG: UDP-N-acetylmuramate--L-alanine ligase [Candidatus Pacebacteria bacterium]|nr:UDP-N-acetylmuramate--L-alanine ligase [Candidatus Paceibacterota bacterium]
MDMKKIDIEKLKKIYFIGIGGIGTSAIARYMKSLNKEVVGSDIKPSLVTKGLEKIGIEVNYGQVAENITDDIDLVIHTASVPKTNPELAAAAEKGLQTITYAESLGLVFNSREGIAICGTHGKSTTTAMVGGVLEDGGIDPSVLVGSIVPRYGSNLRVGNSGHFVAEACEYSHNFMSLYPHITILNNIELDHTDCYEDINKMKESFLDFLRHLPENGVLICNGDDKNVREVALKIKSEKGDLEILYFGKDEKNDFYLKNFRAFSGRTHFEVMRGAESLGEFSLRVPGEFNARNAMAAIVLGVYLNIPTEKIKESLEGFLGIWRRFEIKGEYKGTLVISDYAHHPTAVDLTIRAAKEFYPDRRIVAVFQPHQHNRTRGLYEDFLKSFDFADEIILSEIYDVAGREETEDQAVSSRNLVEDIQKRNKKLIGHIFYAKDLGETRKFIDEKTKPGDILLIMGAGDIFEIADGLVKTA